MLFVAMIRGEMLLTSVAGVVRVPACSVWYGPAVMLVGLSAGDDSVGIAWVVDDGHIPAEGSLCVMDELSAMVLQDAAFDSPHIVAGASCSRSGILDAALVYLSRRLLDSEREIIPNSPGHQAGNEWVNRARQYMQANLDGPLTLAALSASLGCSPATLLRAFKACGLPSPIRCLAELRIEQAKARLLQSELSISNIAVSLGFPDLASFSHVFRKHTGQSPRDYRQNCRWLL